MGLARALSGCVPLRFEVLPVREDPFAPSVKRASLFESQEWLAAPWFQDEYFYAVLKGGADIRALTLVRVISDPCAYDAHNLRDLCAGIPPVFPITDDQLNRRQLLAPSNSGNDHWFPNVIAMFPGYVSDVLIDDSSTLAVEGGKLVEELLHWADASGYRAVAFLYVDDDNSSLCQLLSNMGFLRFSLTYRSLLTLRVGSFEDRYLASLPSRRARTIRYEIASLRERGITTVREELDQGTAQEVLKLRLALIRKYGHDIDTKKEEARLEWLRNQDFIGVDTFVARQQGHVLGFTMFLRWGVFWYAYMTGSVHGNQARFVYFDTAFYSPIRFLAEESHATSLIDYGIGHNEAKVLRGCRNVAVSGWIGALDHELADWVKGLLLER